MAANKRPRMWTYYERPRHDFLPKVRPQTVEHEDMAQAEAERQTAEAARQVRALRRDVEAELRRLRADASIRRDPNVNV